ncbi:MAG: LysE family translocator [Candidatus Arsenophonus melophagi]|nr:LysE family translocator [Candidatus Arsenophonus melophagi]
MSHGLIFALFTFLFIVTITPGQNNLLFTSSGAQYGLRRSIPLMFGVILGIQSILLISAGGLAVVLLVSPVLQIMMKLIGSLYLLWLAWKLATSYHVQLNTDSQVAKSIKWYQVSLLQFLNPKAWMMGLGAVSSYSVPDNYVSSILIISFVMFIVNVIGGFIWIGFGTLIGVLLRGRNAWFIFNITMSIFTLTCIPFIWLH